MDFGTALIPKESPPSAHSSGFFLLIRGESENAAVVWKRVVLSAFRLRKAGILEERSGSLFGFGFMGASEREVDCFYMNISWF